MPHSTSNFGLAWLFSIVFLLFSFAGGYSQVVSGTISDENNEPLPFATVYLPGQNTGTASNEEGKYILKLKPGTYTVVFQYLGYEALEQVVRVRNENIELNVSLSLQPVVLESVTVSSDREDPAYTIMRKAIAKAKYHTQQVDSFSANVYIKGSGRLKDLPGLFRKKIEKALAE